MRRLLSTLLILCLTIPGVQAALPIQVDGERLPSLAPMLERVTPAVVNISTVSIVRQENHPLMRDPFFRWFFELPREQQRKRNQSLGSGVITDAGKGLVLTNHHVIEQADEIRVTLHDGRELVADLLGSDPDTDIAILRISATDLTAVRAANSDRLRIGDFVVAIGNPFGLKQTVTSGIVSALGRSGLGIEGYENFIQTDASINPGNSGGPLVNLRGELVGINTAILAPSGGNVGIGFAIPINMANGIADQIVEFGSVRRGIFGITMQNLTPDLARALDLPANTAGAVVNAVKSDSAAQQAGLRPGDLIVSLNRRAVISATDLQTQLALLRVGDHLKLEIYRKGRHQVLNARMADPYEHFLPGSEIDRRLRGATFAETLDESSLGSHRGIAVGLVEEDSAAWRRGLREGDVIFEVNRFRVKTLRRLGEVAESGISRIKLRRGDRLVTLAAR